jgi:hypothetical protein
VSVEATAWANAQHPGSITRKAVLKSLADAHNAHTGRCFPAIERICSETDACDRAVRKALADLEGSGLISRIRRRRRDGSLSVYEYTLHMDAAEVASEPLAASAKTTSPPPAQDAGRPPAPGAGQELEVDLNLNGNKNLPAVAGAATATPPAVVKVEGHNLAFDALAEVCNIDVRNNAMRGQLARALKEIRAYFWEEVRDVARDLPPEEYEAALARAVRARANEYQGRFSKVEMTPTALSKWWHQMARPSSGRRVLTDADRARIRERPNILKELEKRFKEGGNDAS